MRTVLIKILLNWLAIHHLLVWELCLTIHLVCVTHHLGLLLWLHALLRVILGIELLSELLPQWILGIHHTLLLWHLILTKRRRLLLWHLILTKRKRLLLWHLILTKRRRQLYLFLWLRGWLHLVLHLQMRLHVQLGRLLRWRLWLHLWLRRHLLLLW
jgi:hypothetical protein